MFREMGYDSGNGFWGIITEKEEEKKRFILSTSVTTSLKIITD